MVNSGIGSHTPCFSLDSASVRHVATGCAILKNASFLHCLLLNYNRKKNLRCSVIFLAGTAILTTRDRLRSEDDSSLLREEVERKIAAEFRQMAVEEDSFQHRNKRLEAGIGNNFDYATHGPNIYKDTKT
jgi:hypothetical protein